MNNQNQQKIIEKIVSTLNSSPKDIDLAAADLIREYRRAQSNENKSEIGKQIISQLTYLIFSLPYMLKETKKIYRGRLVPNHNCCFDRHTALNYPPAKITKPGRANYEGEPVFYASLDFDTMLEEIKPRNQEIVNFGAFNSCTCRPKPESKIHVVPIGAIDHLRRFGRSMIEIEGYTDFLNSIINQLRDDVRRAAQLADAFFADEFSRPDSGDTSQYAVTATLANEFYQDHRIDGLFYPSVIHRSGFNVAFKPDTVDNKIHVESYDAFEVRHYLGYGIAKIQSYAKANNFHDNGQIAWNFSPHGNAKICIPDSGII